jgi:hypothetical protein
VKPVYVLWDKAFKNAIKEGMSKNKAITHAYSEITKKFDSYSLRSYFEEVAGWSRDCVQLYDLSNAHVVLSNGLIESWKDSFWGCTR